MTWETYFPRIQRAARNIPAIYVKHLDDPDRDLRVSENCSYLVPHLNAVFSPCGVAQLGTAKIESAENGVSLPWYQYNLSGQLVPFHGNTTGTDIFLPAATSSGDRAGTPLAAATLSSLARWRASS